MEIVKESKKILNDRNLFFSALIFYVLIWSRDIMHISISFSVISAVSLMFGLIFNPSEKFCYICILLPFCRGIPYSEIILMYICIDFLKKIKHIKWENKVYLPILAIVIIDLIDTFVFDSFSKELVYLVVYMMYVSYVVVEKIYLGYEKKAAIWFSVSTIIASILVVEREVANYGWDYIFTYGVRFGTGVDIGEQFTNFNANEFGLYCSVAVALVLLCYYKDKKIVYIFLSLILSAFGFFSISRTYVLIIAVLWLWIIIFGFKQVKAKFAIIFSMIFAFYIVNRYYGDIYNWIVRYYSDRDIFGIIDGGGGRTRIVGDYFDYYFSSIWGVFLGYSEVYMISLKTSVACHNAIQEMLVSWGIVGFIIAVFWIVQLYKKIKVKKLIRIVDLLPMLVFFVYVQSLQFFTMHNYLILMLISIIAVNVEKKENECG